MGNYYKIKEISTLYGIGVDSLRYYEKIGVLKPKRGSNNYRLYSLMDLYKLNIIRDLRPLGFSMEQIKNYLDNLSIDNTLSLLEEEKKSVRKQMDKLIKIEKSLEERVNVINTSMKNPVNEYSLKELKNRYCIKLNTDISRDEETDFAIQKLHNQYENEIFDLGKQPIGSSVSIENIRNEKTNDFNSVFYILKNKENYDFVLEEGKYLSYYYNGSYKKSPELIKKFLKYAEEKNYNIESDIYEIYHLDNRYTIDENEFLTEIQVKIKMSL